MRSVPEWIAKHDDEKIPNRVKVRVFYRFNGVCQCGCTRKIRFGMKWEADHTVAIGNGGPHRESNLVPLLVDCHKRKTANDVAIKSKTYRMKSKHIGAKTQPKGRALPGTRASGLRKRMNGTVERWT